MVLQIQIHSPANTNIQSCKYLYLTVDTGCFFIGPRCPWSDLWVLVSLTETPCADLTDVTLADEDTNSKLTDNANPRE